MNTEICRVDTYSLFHVCIFIKVFDPLLPQHTYAEVLDMQEAMMTCFKEDMYIKERLGCQKEALIVAWIMELQTILFCKAVNISLI